jgi:hypothetical protein
MRKFFSYVELLQRFHVQVKHGTTGTPDEFAKKLGISRSSLYNLIEQVKSFGIDIEYSRLDECFRYTYPDRVEINLTICQHEE